MADILNDPVKIVMLIILVALEIPAAICLAVWWRKACRGSEKQDAVELKPSRCIDPVIKYCQGCRWGYVNYPAWVETREDLEDCCFESGCLLGYDQGRPEAELKEYEEWSRRAFDDQ